MGSEEPERTFTDVIAGKRVRAKGQALQVADVLSVFPVGVLIGETGGSR